MLNDDGFDLKFPSNKKSNRISFGIDSSVTVVGGGSKITRIDSDDDILGNDIQVNINDRPNYAIQPSQNFHLSSWLRSACDLSPAESEFFAEEPSDSKLITRVKSLGRILGKWPYSLFLNILPGVLCATVGAALIASKAGPFATFCSLICNLILILLFKLTNNMADLIYGERLLNSWNKPRYYKNSIRFYAGLAVFLGIIAQGMLTAGDAKGLWFLFRFVVGAMGFLLTRFSFMYRFTKEYRGDGNPSPNYRMPPLMKWANNTMMVLFFIVSIIIGVRLYTMKLFKGLDLFIYLLTGIHLCSASGCQDRSGAIAKIVFIILAILALVNTLYFCILAKNFLALGLYELPRRTSHYLETKMEGRCCLLTNRVTITVAVMGFLAFIYYIAWQSAGGLISDFMAEKPLLGSLGAGFEDLIAGAVAVGFSLLNGNSIPKTITSRFPEVPKDEQVVHSETSLLQSLKQTIYNCCNKKQQIIIRNLSVSDPLLGTAGL
jgi:hypothetical protein